MTTDTNGPKSAPPDPSAEGGPADRPPLRVRLRRVLVGEPRDLADRSLFHRISLIPFLAWVGLGADGLSSSSYGPQEAFLTLGSHTYLAVGLALLTASTVFIIAAAYSRIIEHFPHGGGGYVVATKLLGEKAGVLSGCALLVDYVLTITVSIAAAGDALFSLLPMSMQGWKLFVEIVLIMGLTTLNIRGVRESVMALVPIFLLFLVTHVVLIGGAILPHTLEVPVVAHSVANGFRGDLKVLGLGGILMLFLHAYSLGGGTYTGLEAVSNGLPIMREPRVHTAKRTMVYMAVSLAITAGGLIFSYLLLNVAFVPGKTMNAALVERLAGGLPLGTVFVVLTLVSEGALLIVGAQAGFIDGPRVLANMAVDSWVPRRFAALSDRLTTQNGIVLMGTASLVALLHARGDVRHLVVMYSINVFLTFSLSMFGMLRMWIRSRRVNTHWKRMVALFGVGFLLCATILAITSVEKFREGGWLTLAATSSFLVLCFFIRSHYRTVAGHLLKLDEVLLDIPGDPRPAPAPPDPAKPTAAVLVTAYSGVGVHTLLGIVRAFSGYFKNVVFVSAGVIDSGGFKGDDAIDSLRSSTEQALRKYVAYANRLGIPATYRVSIGTEAVAEAEKVCLEVAKEFPRVTFFAGQVIFQREQWYHRFLHNQTAFAIQKRLQWQGLTMVILPVRVR